MPNLSYQLINKQHRDLQSALTTQLKMSRLLLNETNKSQASKQDQIEKLQKNIINLIERFHILHEIYLHYIPTFKDNEKVNYENTRKLYQLESSNNNFDLADSYESEDENSSEDKPNQNLNLTDLKKDNSKNNNNVLPINKLAKDIHSPKGILANIITNFNTAISQHNLKATSFKIKNGKIPSSILDPSIFELKTILTEPKEIKTLNVEIEELEWQVNKHKEDLQLKQNEIDDLRSKLSKSEGDFEIAQKEITELKEKLQQKETELEKAKATIQALETKLQVANEKTKELEEKLETTLAALQEEKEKNETQESTNQQITLQLNQANEQLTIKDKEHQKKIEGLESQIKEQNSYSENQDKQIERLTKDLTDLKEHQTQADEELGDLNNTNKTLKKKLGETLELIKQLTEEKTELEKNLEEKKSLLEASTTEAKEQQAQHDKIVNDVTEKLKSVTENLEKTVKEMEQLTKESQAKAQEFQKLKLQFQTQESKLERAEQAAKLGENTNNHQSEKLEKLKTELENTKMMMDLKSEELKKANLNVHAHLHDLNKEKQSKNTEIKTFQERINLLNQQNRTLKDTLQKDKKIAVEAIAQLKQELESANGQNKLLEEEKEKTSQEKTHLETKLKEQGSTIEELMGNNDSLNEQIKNLTENKEKVENELNTTLKSNESLTKDISEMTKTIQQAEEETKKQAEETAKKLAEETEKKEAEKKAKEEQAKKAEEEKKVKDEQAKKAEEEQKVKEDQAKKAEEEQKAADKTAQDQAAAKQAQTDVANAVAAAQTAQADAEAALKAAQAFKDNVDNAVADVQKAKDLAENANVPKIQAAADKAVADAQTAKTDADAAVAAAQTAKTNADNAAAAAQQAKTNADATAAQQAEANAVSAAAAAKKAQTDAGKAAAAAKKAQTLANKAAIDAQTAIDEDKDKILDKFLKGNQSQYGKHLDFGAIPDDSKINDHFDKNKAQAQQPAAQAGQGQQTPQVNLPELDAFNAYFDNKQHRIEAERTINHLRKPKYNVAQIEQKLNEMGLNQTKTKEIARHLFVDNQYLRLIEELGKSDPYLKEYLEVEFQKTNKTDFLFDALKNNPKDPSTLTSKTANTPQEIDALVSNIKKANKEGMVAAMTNLGLDLDSANNNVTANATANNCFAKREYQRISKLWENDKFLGPLLKNNKDEIIEFIAKDPNLNTSTHIDNRIIAIRNSEKNEITDDLGNVSNKGIIAKLQELGIVTKDAKAKTQFTQSTPGSSPPDGDEGNLFADKEFARIYEASGPELRKVLDGNGNKDAVITKLQNINTMQETSLLVKDVFNGVKPLSDLGLPNNISNDIQEKIKKENKNLNSQVHTFRERQKSYDLLLDIAEKTTAEAHLSETAAAEARRLKSEIEKIDVVLKRTTLFLNATVYHNIYDQADNRSASIKINKIRHLHAEMEALPTSHPRVRYYAAETKRVRAKYGKSLQDAIDEQIKKFDPTNSQGTPATTALQAQNDDNGKDKTIKRWQDMDTANVVCSHLKLSDNTTHKVINVERYRGNHFVSEFSDNAVWDNFKDTPIKRFGITVGHLPHEEILKHAEVIVMEFLKNPQAQNRTLEIIGPCHKKLAEAIMLICATKKIPCLSHFHTDLHMPMPKEQLKELEKRRLKTPTVFFGPEKNIHHHAYSEETKQELIKNTTSAEPITKVTAQRLSGR